MGNLALVPIPSWEALERARTAFETSQTAEAEAALAVALVKFCARAAWLAQYAVCVGGRPSPN